MEQSNAHVLKDVLGLVRSDLNEVGPENGIGYTMLDGKHHIFIYLDDIDDEKEYVIEPNRVVDGAHEPLAGTVYCAPYGDYGELMVGCQWCLDLFEDDREKQQVKVQSYEDAMTHLSAVKARDFNWNGLEPVFESTNYIGLYSGEWEEEYYLVHKGTGGVTKVLDGSDFRDTKNYLKELAGEAVLDVASVRLLDGLVQFVRNNLGFGFEHSEENLAGVALLDDALDAEISRRSEKLLQLGGKVEYWDSIYEVINVQHGVVFLEDGKSDHQMHVPVKRFLDQAKAQASLDVLIGDAEGKKPVRENSAEFKDNDLNR